MQGTELMMILAHCGMAVKRMGMLGGSVGKMKALTLKMETVTLTGRGRQNLTCFVYEVYAINGEGFFLIRYFIFGRSS
jgi:fructose-1-phosphate kinase PfkB-like protein